MTSQSDLERLQGAEQKLLSALEAAQKVVELLSTGGQLQELDSLSSAFLADVQDSQATLLAMADEHQQPLPLQGNDYRQRLQLLAAQKQVAAAEARLAAAGAAAAAATAAAATAGAEGQEQR